MHSLLSRTVRHAVARDKVKRNVVAEPTPNRDSGSASLAMPVSTVVPMPMPIPDSTSPGSQCVNRFGVLPTASA
jgi:hypothetical protein